MDWKLGEIQETMDPALALQGAVGKFKVTGPGGDVYVFECAKGYSIKSVRFLEIGEARQTNYFLVEKISEPIATAADLPATNLRHKTAGAR
jgi:hypothetical protein